MSEAFIEARYRLTEADYLVSQRHACWRNFRWLVILMAILFPVGIYDVVANGDRSSFGMMWSVFMALYLVFLFQFYLPRRARKVFRESKSLHNEQLMRIFNDRVEFESSSGLFRLPWADVHKWNEFAGIFALYPSSAMMVIIPAHQVGLTAFNYCKERLAETGLPNRGKGRTS